MSGYVPNPDDATQPTGTVDASTASAEFRALKGKVNGLNIAGIELNPSDKDNNIGLSGANLVATKSSGMDFGVVRSNTGKNVGAWYCEFQITVLTGLGSVGLSMITDPTVGPTGIAYYSNGTVYNYGAGGTPTFATYTVGDYIGVGMDFTALRVSFFKNGNLQGSLALTAGDTYYPMIELVNVNDQIVINFGSTNFRNGIPGAYTSFAAMPAQTVGYRNLIDNSRMHIAQFNASGSFPNVAAANQMIFDRFSIGAPTANIFIFQRVTGPAASEYQQYVGFNSTVVPNYGGTDSYNFKQNIEGYRFDRMAYGTASAKVGTVLMWVTASIAGIYSGCVTNSDYSRTFPFSYTIPVAGVWTPIAVVIPGCTDGTWVTANGIGCRLIFNNFGCNPALLGPDAKWATAGYAGSSSQTQHLLSAVNNNIYFTGTEFRDGIWPPGTSGEAKTVSEEFNDCTRFYFTLEEPLTIQGNAGFTGDNRFLSIPYPTPMRAVPTLNYNFTFIVNSSGEYEVNAGTGGMQFQITAAAAGQVAAVLSGFTANAEFST